MKGVDKKIGDNTYKDSDHVPIAVGFSVNGKYESYFDSDCNKEYLKDPLEMETNHSVYLN